MQFKFYIVSSLFIKLIRIFHSSWSILQKNHYVSQFQASVNKDGDYKGST